MTGRQADRLLGGVLGLALVLVVPSIASRIGLLGPGTLRWWTVVMCLALLGSLLWLVIAAVRGSSATAPARGFVVVAAVAILTYSLAADPAAEVVGRPWVAHLVPTAVGACAVAWRSWTALLPGLALVAAYALLRTTHAWERMGIAAVEDSLFSAVALVAAVVAVGSVRGAAARVAAAARTAERAHARADAAVAELQERARWEAMVHDDILAALQTASSACTPQEWSSAGRTAVLAARRIDVAPRGAPADVAEVRRRLSEAVRGALPDAVVHVQDRPDSTVLPPAVADAVIDATVEAVRNAARHARRGRAMALVQVHAQLGPDGVRVRVRDDGQGFRVDKVPAERLGLRVSVRQRLAAVGGTASWTSSPGRGTEVDLVWRT